MVIERFKDAEAVSAVYRRFHESGRMMPDGLTYVDSWIDASFSRCFLLAECKDAGLIQEWVLRWHDLVDFEVVPIVGSKETAALVEGLEQSGSLATDP